MTTPPHPLLSSDEVEKRLLTLQSKAREVYALHRELLNECRQWLVAMRSIEGVRSYINGATYQQEETNEG